MSTREHETAGMGAGDLYNGILMANKIVDCLWDRIGEAITVIETVKKIPEYNANVSVEYALTCANMKVIETDPRLDDCYLVNDEEPVSVNELISS